MNRCQVAVATFLCGAATTAAHTHAQRPLCAELARTVPQLLGPVPQLESEFGTYGDFVYTQVSVYF